MDYEIEKAIEKLVSIYGELETKLLVEIAKHFKYNEKLLNADYWRLQKLEELGALNKKTVKIIAEASGKTPNEVKKAFKKIGYMTYDERKLKNAYKKKLISINPDEVGTKYIDRAVLDSYDEMMNTFTTISDQVEAGVRKTYLDIIDKTYLEITEGGSYQEAIRNAIDELSNNGIKTVSYITPNGIRNYGIEGLVRRETLTATRQLNARVQMESIQELGVKKILLSENLDCRPTHFDWQGTIINVDDIVEITGYGTITGLCGINCRHYFTPYFGDKEGDDLKKYNKEECEQAYKISQKQRYLERGIRKWKNKAMISQAADDEYEYKNSLMKTHIWQKRLDEYTKNNSLIRKFENEYVSGYKDATVNLIPPKSIVNKLSSVNIVADDSLGKIPNNLLQRNVNQYKKLSEKYNMQDFYKEQEARYLSPDTNQYIGAISYNRNMTKLNINSSYQYFYDKEYLVSKTKSMVRSKWSMPCKEEKYDVYAMTHEFGHTLEMKMYKEKYVDGNNIGYSYYASKVKDDIIKIALEKHSEEEVLNAISEYGKSKKTQEFFAEAFANMELGKSNIIGDAMKIYLKKEGIIK